GDVARQPEIVEVQAAIDVARNRRRVGGIEEEEESDGRVLALEIGGEADRVIGAVAVADEDDVGRIDLLGALGLHLGPDGLPIGAADDGCIDADGGHFGLQGVEADGEDVVQAAEKADLNVGGRAGAGATRGHVARIEIVAGAELLIGQPGGGGQVGIAAAECGGESQDYYPGIWGRETLWITPSIWLPSRTVAAARAPWRIQIIPASDLAIESRIDAYRKNSMAPGRAMTIGFGPMGIRVNPFGGDLSREWRAVGE